LALRRLPFVVLPLALILVACGGHAKQVTLPTVEPSVAPTLPPTQVPASVLTPTPDASITKPDGNRILSYDQKLSVDIGPRPKATEKEKEAIDYISGLLESFGYEVTLQDFPALTEASRESTLSVSGATQRTVIALPVTLSGTARVQGKLISAGRGTPPEFPASVAGNIALIARGDFTLQEKVSNAVAAGATGVIIYNNEDGTFLGGLSASASIPVISISLADGQALVGELALREVSADLFVGSTGTTTAHNVVAKPPGKDCATVTGGHFDTVPGAPGASDNGSGTATVLEIANVIAKKGEIGSNCFVLFGAEEPSLLGSQAFVRNLTAAQKRQLKVMFNFDMVGVGDDYWAVIGTPEFQSRAVKVAGAIGMEVRPYQLNASDHVSFASAGIPVLWLYRLTDNLLHTPQDVIGRVRPELLAQAAQFGIDMLESLSGD
jgi:aminopeptidase YwaD